MRAIRVHVEQPLAAGAEISLPAGAGEHLTRVLRLAAGARVLLFNGDGHDYPATLLDTTRNGARARIEGAQAAAAAESALALTLVQSIARGEKMDWILQKATELGVARIVPVFTARTEVRLDGGRGDKRLAHWRGVICAACEQCGRARLPQLDAPQPLAHWLATAAREGSLLMLDPQSSTRVRDLPALSAAQLVIGPEGGLDAADLLMLRAAGARGLALGPRVLRTETAGMAALAMLQSHHGDA
ncbi:16S rRNA (uracil(1498)-N(3))-methyltransferase [Metallibacterium sp.]|uniref:16S rRNA (uracil(1498)-N(3))-methyltransferase n=1 Tax=Metallibacterium sp. TaxID=2940281 RepID=UPI002635CEFD|nr:16S rRNA (uracil(1498)-N(3))-methyltransferase [Metallibacterium sp.]